MACSKFDQFREQFIHFIDEIYTNFFLIVYEKSLNISDDSENDFEDKA